jgi:GntR family transcriptional regulator, transcriptional repressor for pyruvate dehydrogenase complex
MEIELSYKSSHYGHFLLISGVGIPSVFPICIRKLLSGAYQLDKHLLIVALYDMCAFINTSMSSLQLVQPPAPPLRKRSRSLASDVIEGIERRIQSGQLQPGDKLPSEAEIVREYGVSRTVVREALSKLQTAGWVDTQHGVGTFVLEHRAGASFRLNPGDIATAMDVLAVLELRVSLEAEAAGLAAQRRTTEHLVAMRRALDDFEAGIEQGTDTIAPDIQFHLQIARATGNRYFVDVMSHLGSTLLPRTRLNTSQLPSAELSKYLRRVNLEHEQIYDGIARQDIDAARAAMRLHLGNGRERQRRALPQHSST